jgi:hypothetical protein
MIDEPKPTPVTIGCEIGAVAPGCMKTEAGLMTAFVVSELVRVTGRPLAGAGAVRVTGKGKD